MFIYILKGLFDFLKNIVRENLIDDNKNDDNI